MAELSWGFHYLSLRAGPRQWPPLFYFSDLLFDEYIDDVVEEVNAKEALKSSIFVVQKAAAPKTGVESRQSSIGTIRSSLATSYNVWRRRATSLLVIRKLTTHWLTHPQHRSWRPCGPKNQDEDLKEGCTYWAYTTTFVVLVSRVLQISICTLTFNLPFHHRTVMWYFGWNEGLCDIFTVFLSKPYPKMGSKGSVLPEHPRILPDYI